MGRVVSFLAAALCVAAAAAAERRVRCSCSLTSMQCYNVTHILEEDICEGNVFEWSLDHNALTNLEFIPSSCPIIMLDVSYNNIRMLGDRLKKCEKLTLLLLSNNPLYSLPESAFQNLTKLVYLELERTSLSKLREGTFAGLPALYSLNLSGNNFTELPEKVFKGLSHLNFLDFSRNKITNFPDKLFEDLRELRVLNVSENRLVRLQPTLFAKSPELLALHLNDNKLVYLDDELFVNLFELRRLEAQGNQLQQIPVLQECCAAMSYADFRSNNISAPSVDAVKALLNVSRRLETLMTENPVSRDALCDVLSAGGVTTCVETDHCLCGKLRPCRESEKCWSFVRFCEKECKTHNQDWIWMDSAISDAFPLKHV